MKDYYICIGGKKIEFTEEQVAKLCGAVSGETVVETGVKLSTLGEGETFKVGEHEFIVLEHLEGNTAVILKNLLYTDKEFGENNNYADSDVDTICNEFGDKIKGIVGADNLVEHIVDLTSDDGLKDYGTIHRFMSLITADMYRRYVAVLDEHKIDAWWWLATPFSTPRHDDSDWVKCVSPHGYVDCNDYDFSYGVRPFCILKSNIFVSK